MADNSVYIVSGYMRSGTSMMMKSLNAGGVEAVYSRSKDQILNNRFNRDDYAPNPDGFFELGPKEFNADGFPEVYSGKLIKALHWRLKSLPPFDYKIIFMKRDPVEIEVSYLKMFQKRPPFVLYKYEALLGEICQMMDSRTDMDYLIVEHRDVIENPNSVFQRIQKSGWPLTDTEKAVSAIRPSLYRSKKEDLNSVRQEIPGLRTDLPDVLKHKN